MVKGFTFIKIAIFFLVVSTTVFAQNFSSTLKVELIKKSDKPLGRPIHYHLFRVTNASNNKQEFTINVNDKSCAKINTNQQSKLITEIYNKDLSQKLDKIILNSKESKEFYIKTTRPSGIKLDTWSCFEVDIESITGKTSRGSLVMKINVPDPENVD